jgi:leucyl aminopeptidase
MPQIDVTAGPGACDALVLPIAGRRAFDPATAELLAALGLDLDPAGLAADLSLGTDGRCRVIPTLGQAPVRALVVVDASATPQAAELRELAMVAVRGAAPFAHIATTLTQLLPDVPGAVEAVVEGLVLGSYRFGASGRSVDPVVERVTLIDPRPEAAGSVGASRLVAEATNVVRTLVDTPAGDLPPLAIAERAEAEATSRGMAFRIIRGDELEHEGFGGLVAVGAGSHREPCLVTVTYDGAPGRAPVVIAGKGITFDSGGLDLKPLSSMATMKQDMAGAATALGAVIAAADLELPVKVTAILALAENMPGGGAMRPGDIVRHRGGLTTEVISPDSEGRLVLSDALGYGAELGPAALVDVATLTGGGGLGPDLWAIFGTDRALVEAIVEAGRHVGDAGWELPVWPPYDRFLVSPLADLRNSAIETRYPIPALQGASYLRAFVGDAPWAHLDTSAVASRGAAEATDAWSQGATGSPTRALIEWLRRPDGRG